MRVVKQRDEATGQLSVLLVNAAGKPVQLVDAFPAIFGPATARPTPSLPTPTT